jgi:glycosyltransferase involved in cell wall biosynthesis
VKPLPLVSIVIPAYNPRFFQRTLHSALNQTYTNYEIVICDDCRTEEIKEVVDSFAGLSILPIRYIKNPQRLGFVANLLKCLGEARGEFIKFLCDDDQLLPVCIETQVDGFTTYDDIALVLGQRYFWDADDVQLPDRIENIPLSYSSSVFKGEDMLGIIQDFPYNFLGGLSSALMRRSSVQEYLPALSEGSLGFVALLDLMLFSCLMRRGNLLALNNVLIIERLHSDRLSRQQVMIDAMCDEVPLAIELLEARSGEPAPAKGWVRYVPLVSARDFPLQWKEHGLSRALVTLQSRLWSNVGLASQSFSEFYAQWLGCKTISAGQRRLLPIALSHWSRHPKIVPIIIDELNASASMSITLQSIAGQLYPPELVIVLSKSCTETTLEDNVFTLPLQGDVFSQINQLLSQLDGAQWFYLLRAGDRLVESALLMLAERAVKFDEVRCIYGDEGALRDGESTEPVFKPDFNLDFLRSYPYVGRNLAFHRESCLALGGFDSCYGELAPHDLLWRLFESQGERAVLHIADVMVESQLTYSQWLSLPEVVEQNPQVVGAHLDRLGITHAIQPGIQLKVNQITYVHSERPLVSIIITHKDQLAALQRCTESLLEKTAYNHFEVIVVDNGSVSAEAREWLSGMAELSIDRLRILHHPAAAGMATLRNVGAAHARGTYLLMLSPYTVVTHSDWLDKLLNHAQRPEVGVVGAKVFNAQGLILHAGVILGMEGTAGFPFYGENMNAAGYMHRLQVAQDLSAVAGDCMLVRRELFEAISGFDDIVFSQAFDEVDFCLRVRQAGYLVVWAPDAKIAIGEKRATHQDESQRQRQAVEQDILFDRWLPMLACDPAYNKNLALNGCSYRLEPGLLTGWSPYSSEHLPKMLILPINSSAVGHYRMTQPFLELEAVARVVGQINYGWPTVIEVERQSPDIVVFQGRYFEGGVNQIALAKKHSNARRIYELDDNVIEVPVKNGHMRNAPAHHHMVDLLKRGISNCDRVVVSTESLGNVLAPMHTDIRVVPNMLAPHLWQHLRSQRRTSKKPRIGWGGGTSHTGDLEVIADVVRELAHEVEWVFFGMCPKALRPYLHEFHPVIDLDAYPAKLASLNLDLALAPLEFHIFNDCKSNLRLLEYGACGFPVICTNTEAYQGYMPCTRVMTNTADEWLQAIRMHLADPDASYRMGDELREVVMRDYMLRGDNLQHWVTGWLAD